MAQYIEEEPDVYAHELTELDHVLLLTDDDLRVRVRVTVTITVRLRLRLRFKGSGVMRTSKWASASPSSPLDSLRWSTRELVNNTPTIGT